MLDLYQTTPLEEWIESHYQSIGIYSPCDLDIDNIAHSFGAEVVYMPGAKEEAIWDDEKVAIFLNSDKPNEEIREAFFHELCHPLRHSGNQLMLPRIFRELQETQANQFQLYAAMPFFMIRQMRFQDGSNIIYLLSEEFRVTHKLASHRLDQIRRRIYYGQAREEFVKKLRSQYTKAEPQPYSAETIRLLEQLKRQVAKKGE